jgi:hypothetical protein
MPRYEGQIQHMFNFVTGFIPSFIRSEVHTCSALRVSDLGRT